MSADICRNASSAEPSAGGGTKVVASCDELGMFVSELIANANTRQGIIKLYDDLRLPLQAYLCCLGMSTDQAEDVIQETFLRLVSYRVSQDGENNLRAWVFRVAHNLSMDVHRFQRRWSASDEDDAHGTIRRRADPAPTPEQQVILEEKMRRFKDAFGQLTPKQRQCVLLRVEGFRYREIAVALGISVQRVGELMQRSISLLEIHK
jgi:RNA polymerase sigma-70 factor, ECF subfamily